MWTDITPATSHGLQERVINKGGRSKSNNRSIDNTIVRLCFHTVESLLRQNFLKEIRMTFGAGGFMCSFSDKELAEFHHFLEKNFPYYYNDP